MAKLFKIVIVLLLLITALNAMVAGGMFVFDPSGHQMGLNAEYLKYSPFNTFLIPGIVLFLVNGVMNLFTAVMVVKNHPQLKKLVTLQGILLSGWIVVQVLMVRDINPLHIVMISVGVIFIVFGTTYKIKTEDD